MNFNLICSNGTYIGILNGHPSISTDITQEQLHILVNNPTEEQVLEIFNPKLAEVKEHNKQLEMFDDVLVASGLFTHKDGCYYREGIPYSVPKLLLEKYLDCLTNNLDYSKWDMFWQQNAVSVTKKVKEHLFDFLQKQNFPITKKGPFIAYRNVNILKEGNRKLAKFVTSEYFKVKNQKKSPLNYAVYQDREKYVREKEGSVKYETYKKVGNLESLYKNIDSIAETVYTYAYRGSGAGKGLDSNEIRIGKPYRIKPEVVNISETECEAGLHFCSWDYLTQHSGYALGEVKMAVLVSPADCASFPTSYNSGKGRGFGMLPLGEVTEPITEVDDVFGDIYMEDVLKEVNRRLKEIDPNNAPIYSLERKELTPQVFKNVEEYREILKSKTVDLYDNDDEEIDEYDFE